LRRGEARGFDACSEGEASDLVEEIPMARNDAVGELGGGGDPRIDTLFAERFKNRARAAGYAAVRKHQLHRLRVGFAGDLWEAVADILRREVLDAIARDSASI